MTDGGHPGLGLASGLEALDVRDDRPEQSIRLESREHAANTGMHTVTPTDVAPVIPLHVKPIRVGPLARIAVGGGEHEAATLALRDDDPVDLHIAHRDALSFDSHGRFLAYAARAMRGLVIDSLRANGASKRGGDLSIIALDTMTAEELRSPDDLQDISDALDELATVAPELARVVDLRFFCGFTMQEIASQLGISERSVQRQWDKARALLFVAMKGD